MSHNNPSTATSSTCSSNTSSCQGPDRYTTITIGDGPKIARHKSGITRRVVQGACKLRAPTPTTGEIPAPIPVSRAQACYETPVAQTAVKCAPVESSPLHVPPAPTELNCKGYQTTLSAPSNQAEDNFPCRSKTPPAPVNFCRHKMEQQPVSTLVYCHHHHHELTNRCVALEGCPMEEKPRHHPLQTPPRERCQCRNQPALPSVAASPPTQFHPSQTHEMHLSPRRIQTAEAPSLNYRINPEMKGQHLHVLPAVADASYWDVFKLRFAGQGLNFDCRSFLEYVGTLLLLIVAFVLYTQKIG